jgi:hypothetical protein
MMTGIYLNFMIDLDIIFSHNFAATIITPLSG